MGEQSGMEMPENDKRDSVEAALEEGIVMLHIDSRCDGVDVPPQSRGNARLLLNIAWGFKLPALDIDDNGIYAVLRFGAQDYGCTVPWAALYAITQPEHEQRGVLWPRSMPAEAIAAAPELRGIGRVVLGPPEDESGPRTGPRLVQDPAQDPPQDPAALPDGSESEGGPETDPEPPEPPRGRSHLRLVK
jgi:stringent starvation protein B